VLLRGERGGVTGDGEDACNTPPGQFLAEVDADLTIGSAITAGDFVTRADSEADGFKALQTIPTGKGRSWSRTPSTCSTYTSRAR
jgi:hypothetical protein